MRCLFDEFATMDDDEGFVTSLARGNSTDQLGKYDLSFKNKRSVNSLSM